MIPPIRTMTLALALALTAAAPLRADEASAEANPESRTQASATTVRAVDPSRRVPPHFGQIGLSAEQKEAIYKVRGKHQAKIDALKKEIEKAQAEMLGECEALLSDSQKQLLTLRREAAAKSARSKAGTPVAAKEAKPIN